MVKRNRKKENKYKILISVFTIIVVSIALLYSGYYFVNYKSNGAFLNPVKKQVAEINKANDAAAEIIKNTDFGALKDATAIINTFSNSEKILSKANEELNKLKAPSKFTSQFNLFVKAVSYNQRIYTQSIAILKNPKSNDIQNASNALSTYIENADKFYASSSISGIKISLPKELLVIEEKIHVYAYKEFTDFQNKEALLKQYQSYFDSMDLINTNLERNKTDLDSYYVMLKNKHTTFNDVHVAIDKKRDRLNEIEKSYKAIVVPPKAAEIHQEFYSVLNGYKFYCDNFKQSLIFFEENMDNSDAANEIESSFAELKGNFEIINAQFGKYIEKYNNTKTTLSDINNL